MHSALIQRKGNKAMKIEIKNFANIILDNLFDMSVKLTKSTLLTEVLQPLENRMNGKVRKVLTIPFIF